MFFHGGLCSKTLFRMSLLAASLSKASSALIFACFHGFLYISFFLSVRRWDDEAAVPHDHEL